MPNGKELIARYEKLKGARSNFESLWEEIARYCIPSKSNIISTQTKGARQTRYLFDSTAIYASRILASTLAGSLTNPGTEWFSLKIRQSIFNDQDEVREWLEECTKRMYMALRESNFYKQIAEAYTDLSIFALTGLLIEEKDPTVTGGFGGLRFNTCPVKEIFIVEGKELLVDTIFRKITLTARTARDTWGEENLTKEIREALEKEPDKEFDFLHCVLPRRDRKAGEDSKSKPWASIHMTLKEGQIINESGYNTFPYAIARWSTSPGEVYGRGPAFDALPDILSLNKSAELGLMGLAKAVAPPLMVRDQGVIGALDLTPNGLTVVRNIPQETIAPMPSGERWDVVLQKETELKQSIKRIFLADQIEAFLSTEGGNKTATEVQLRYEVMQQLLGPTLGQIQTELLGPIVKTVFQMMYNAKTLPTPPEILSQNDEEGNRPNVDIEYESPLAKAQRIGEVRAISNLYQQATIIAPIYPEVFDNIDHDKAMQRTGEILGVPADVMNDEETIKKIRQARVDQKEQEKTGEDALKLAEGLGKVSPYLVGRKNGQ